MRHWLLGLGTVLAVGVFVAPSDASASNEIISWNNQALETIRTERKGAAEASRTYAMVNAAMYDAVNGIDRRRHRSTRDHAIVPPNGAPRLGNRHAAAAAAGHAVLSALYPSQAASYDAQLASDLAGLGNGWRVNRGIEWGEEVGAAVVAARANDGSSPQEILPGGTAPGQFRPDFTSAQYRNMAPFAVANPDVYVSPGPPALDSPEYAAAFEDVRLLGDARYANTNYDEIYRFWRGGGGSARPPGEWIKVAIVIAEDRGTTHFLSRTARLFALLGMALADSTISVWTAKNDFAFWRPATAIPEAGTDGNAETTADAAWSPRNGSAGSSPEHTSGQSAYAGAGSTVISEFYCSDAIEFTFTGDDSIAGARTFQSVKEAAAEAGRARIFAGIHFEFSNQGGQATGRGTAREVMANSLQRNSWARHFPDCPPY